MIGSVDWKTAVDEREILVVVEEREWPWCMMMVDIAGIRSLRVLMRLFGYKSDSNPCGPAYRQGEVSRLCG